MNIETRADFDSEVIADDINTRLKNLADLMITEFSSCNDIGVNGKAGVVLYLFHYARVSRDSYYLQQAAVLLETIKKSIDEKTSAANESGVAGLACVVLFLIKEQFINHDLEKYFGELDRFLHIYLKACDVAYPDTLVVLTGVARYYTERIRQAKDITSPAVLFNRNALGEIINTLACPYNSYTDILHAMDILTLAGTVDVKNKQAQDYWAYAIDKLETMQYEDRYFKKNLTGFNYARFSLAFSKAAACWQKPQYATIASDYLKKDVRFNAVVTNDEQVLEDITMADLLLFNAIACQQDHSIVRKYCFSALSKISPKEINETAYNKAMAVPYGLVNGYAAMGMSLMCNAGLITDNWLQLIV